ncbi:hypothetical protein ACSQ67_019977 [Phaseolus vulgaris]
MLISVVPLMRGGKGFAGAEAVCRIVLRDDRVLRAGQSRARQRQSLKGESGWHGLRRFRIAFRASVA